MYRLFIFLHFISCLYSNLWDFLYLFLLFLQIKSKKILSTIFASFHIFNIALIINQKILFLNSHSILTSSFLITFLLNPSQFLFFLLFISFPLSFVPTPSPAFTSQISNLFDDCLRKNHQNFWLLYGSIFFCPVSKTTQFYPLYLNKQDFTSRMNPVGIFNNRTNIGRWFSFFLKPFFSICRKRPQMKTFFFDLFQTCRNEKVLGLERLQLERMISLEVL